MCGWHGFQFRLSNLTNEMKWTSPKSVAFKLIQTVCGNKNTWDERCARTSSHARICMHRTSHVLRIKYSQTINIEENNGVYFATKPKVSRSNKSIWCLQISWILIWRWTQSDFKIRMDHKANLLQFFTNFYNNKINREVNRLGWILYFIYWSNSKLDELSVLGNSTEKNTKR